MSLCKTYTVSVQNVADIDTRIFLHVNLIKECEQIQ